MARLPHQLDRASDSLRRSVLRVRRAPDALAPVPPQDTEHATLRPRRSDSARDQSVAALHAIVWIASFVQAVFNEIAGRSDDF